MTDVKVHWLFDDTYITDREAMRLREAIHRQGMEAREIRRIDLISGVRDPYPPDACVVFHGPVQATMSILRTRKWRPGAWLTEHNYRCSTYYPHFERFLLNVPYELCSLGTLTLSRNKEILCRYAVWNRVFLRPDSGLKPFTGTVVDLVDPDMSLASICYSRDKDEMVLVSRPKRIMSEWRIFIVEEEIITGTRYLTDGETDMSPDVPEEVYSFVREILAATTFRPDPAFSMDVCSDPDGRLRLLEINGLSGAGIYEANADKIVQAASRLASKTYSSKPSLADRSASTS